MGEAVEQIGQYAEAGDNSYGSFRREDAGWARSLPLGVMCLGVLQHLETTMENPISESMPVVELADVLDVPTAAVVRDGLDKLGLLLTTHDDLSLEQARSIR